VKVLTFGLCAVPVSKTDRVAAVSSAWLQVCTLQAGSRWPPIASKRRRPARLGSERAARSEEVEVENG